MYAGTFVKSILSGMKNIVLSSVKFYRHEYIMHNNNTYYFTIKTFKGDMVFANFVIHKTLPIHTYQFLTTLHNKQLKIPTF